MLSYCEKPYEGELLYGFALRMYRYNEEPESFRRFAFRNFGIGYGTGRGTKIPYDYVTDAERAAAENIRLRSFPDIRRLVFEMLPTGAILPFMRFSHQARYMEAVLHGAHNFIRPVRTTRSLPYLKLCPDCMREDIKRYGEAYYHAEHHIPGMKICPKHLCPLKMVRTERAADLWEQADAFRTDGEEAVAEMRTEIFRSGFLAGLYREPAYTDFTEIIRSVQNKIQKEGLAVSEAYERIRERYGMQCAFNGMDRFELFLQRQVKDGECLLQAAETYLTVREMGADTAGQERALRTELQGRFELLSDFGVIVKLKCGCGREFYTHPYALLMGLGCPSCDEKLSPEELANRMLSRLGDGKYHTDYVHEKIKACRVIHDTCGAYRDDFYDIVFGEKRCKCEVVLSLDEYQDLIDKKRREFLAESFVEDPSGRKIRIRHKKCGGVFDVKPVYFLPNLTCRICSPRYVPSLSVDQAMEALTGKEYVRISPYGGYRDKMLVRHASCGTWFAITPDGFREGYRCPLCIPVTWPREYVERAVHDCTDGLYNVEEVQRDRVTVRCADGTVFHKTRSFIIQELIRPTPSAVFRFRSSRPETLINDRFTVFDRARETCEREGHWIAEDISGISHGARRSICRWLNDNGYLKRVEKGVYVLGERTYPPENNKK